MCAAQARFVFDSNNGQEGNGADVECRFLVRSLEWNWPMKTFCLLYVWLGKPVAEAVDPSRASKAVRKSGVL
ncbi:MAG: hypothetical protein DME22_22520 [Verrucomicrobia bacterium]|nr:MAG: hypothetical protein DME22_22520 [Verrucomicrobiota bacterium]PYJ96463.1 MAG: hypothetical protein DME23_20540 [Verrucomicrobiota bacterium]